MSNNKEILRKLYKIAQNQQKIIMKLAESKDITADVNAMISRHPHLNGLIKCRSAKYGTDFIEAEMICLKSSVGDPKNAAIKAACVTALAANFNVSPANVNIILSFLS